MLDLVLLPLVGETRRQTANKPDPALDLAQQQRSSVARYAPGAETGLHPAHKMRCKMKFFLATLCHEKNRPFLGHIYASTTQLCHRKDGLSAKIL
jgi:hypothetical protein